MNFEKELREHFDIIEFNTDDMIDINMNSILCRGEKSTITISFDGYELDNPREYQYIMDCLFFIQYNFNCIEQQVKQPLKDFINNHYQVNIDNPCADTQVELYEISFVYNDDINDICALHFNTKYDEEHAIEAVLKYWNFKDIHLW